LDVVHGASPAANGVARSSSNARGVHQTAAAAPARTSAAAAIVRECAIFRGTVAV
jgi:hypothetical protein